MRITDKFVFFWMGEDVYSNFYYSPFTHQGIEFKWSEQAIMYRKAMLFGAVEIAQHILEADTPARCKFWGRSHDIPFNEDVWVKNREIIYKEVLRDKFALPELKKQILSTKNLTLVEASPTDKIWGIGLSEKHRHATDPTKWRGLNLLGKVLMEVREELRHIKCIRKPIVYEAVQWFEGMELNGVYDKAMLSEVWFDKGADDGRYHIWMDGGTRDLWNGAYIVKKSNGDIQLYRENIFHTFFEEVSE